MQYTIYLIKNIVNNKVYVGQTSDHLKRSKAHFALLRKGTHYNPRLQNSFNKYGESAFKFQVHETCKSESDLSDSEIYWIATFKAIDPNYGYNICKGGRNPNSEANQRPVYQYTLTGVFIQEFISIVKAAAEVGCNNPQTISNACIGRHVLTANGFRWKYKDKASEFEVLPPLEEHHLRWVDPYYRSIDQYDLNNNFIMHYASSIEAALALGRVKEDAISIRQCLLGKNHTAFGSIWRWHSNGLSDEDLEQSWSGKWGIDDRAVRQYTKQGEFIQEFISVSEAARIMSVTPSAIYSAAKTHRGARGFLFRYADENLSEVEAFVNPKFAPVYRYTKEGEFVDEFKSTADAGRALGITPTCVYSAIVNHRLAGGFQFRYVNEVESQIDIKPYVSKHLVQIDQYDLQGKYITTYPSVKAASQVIGRHQSLISSCLRGKTKQACNFIWKYSTLKTQ